MAGRDWGEDFPVFPIEPGGKRPLTDNGLKDATNDRETLEQWARWWPDANIGHCPDTSGHWVLDIDTKPNKDGITGLDSLENLEREHGPLPSTLVIRTPSGGLHYWFYGRARTHSRTVFGPGIDTRGVGGYVLIEGSIVGDREYSIERDDAAADAPAWMVEQLSRKFEDSKTATVDELDRDIDIKRARKYLEEANPAIEGDGGDDWTYRIACTLKDIGISQDTAHNLMLEVWNQGCEPPWDSDELWAKVDHAYAYGQNEPGAKAIDDTRGRFTAEILAAMEGCSDAPPDTLQPIKRERFTLRDETAQDERRPPQWIIPGWLPTASSVMLYGPPQSYKSFVALDMALSIAAGRPWAGTPGIAQGDVVYLAGEGALGIEKQRRPAWRAHHEIEGPLPFWVTDDMPLLKRGDDEVPMLVEAIQKKGIQPKLLVVDTLNRFGTGMNENDAADASTMVYYLDLLRSQFPGASIMAIHHAGKDNSRGARGSSAFQGNFDVILSVTGHQNTRTTMISAGAPHGKMKDAEPPVPRYFKGQEVGSSLVFSTIRSTEYYSLVADGGEVTAKQVAAALKKLGDEAEVNSTMLAIELLGTADDEKEVNKVKKQLSTKARGELAGFVDTTGPSALWRLPRK